jgi:hypothetical protein
VGLRHDGNDPVAHTQTRCPRARVQGTDQNFVALVVPGGVGIEALCNVVRGCTSNASGPVSAIETSGGSSAKRWLSARGGCRDAVRLLTTLRPIRTLPRPAEELVFGS